jgi:hypothetical protein
MDNLYAALNFLGLHPHVQSESLEAEARQAGNAYWATCRARSQTSGRDLNDAIRLISILMRNLLVWRVQRLCGLSERDRIKEELSKALGTTGLNDQGTIALLLHAWEQEIAAEFPQAALSSTKKNAHKRKGRRPARHGPHRDPDAEPQDDTGDAFRSFPPDLVERILGHETTEGSVGASMIPAAASAPASTPSRVVTAGPSEHGSAHGPPCAWSTCAVGDTCWL